MQSSQKIDVHGLSIPGNGHETNHDHFAIATLSKSLRLHQSNLTIDDESRDVGPGCAVYIPPGAVQSIENTGAGDLIFLCIVDPAWRPEDEEILDA